MKPNAEDGDNCCKSLPKESTCVNEPSEDSVRSVDVQRPPDITTHRRQSSWDDDNNEPTKNLRKTPMESNQLEATHPEQSLNLSTDENEFQDLKNPLGFQKNRQNSFIRDNLDHDFSKKGCVYEDKDMHCSVDISILKQDSATDRKQSNLEHSTDHTQDSGANSDKPDMSEDKAVPEILLSGKLSSSNGIFLQSPGNRTNNSEPNAESSSHNQSLPSLTQGDQLVTVSGLKSIETSGSGCNQDGADANSENSKHVSQPFQNSPKNKLGEASSRARVEPETNIPGLSLQQNVTLSGKSNISFQNLHPAQTSQGGQNVQSTDVHTQNQSNTGSPTTLSVEAEGQNRSNSCSNVRFLIDDRSYSCDDSNRPQVQTCSTFEQGTLMEGKARGFPNQNANGSPTQHMSSDASESTSSGVSIENESRDSERTSSEESEANETTSSLSSSSIRRLMQGIVELYKSTE